MQWCLYFYSSVWQFLVEINKKKLLNSYNWQSECPNYQMTAFVFFIFKSAGEGRGGLRVTLKETSKGWVCDNFPRQFHFFLGTFHEKHKCKYFNNLTVKVCKIWCNDVYMYILYCDIFWWKLIDRIFLIRFLIPRWFLRASPFFPISTALHEISPCRFLHSTS
jgi:hypothetical protein